MLYSTYERPYLLRLHAREPSQRYAFVGITNDLSRRLCEHRNGLADGLTKKHGVNILVWYEVHGDVYVAIAREKQLKGWNRAWKLRLIEANNSGWNDLIP